MSSRVSQAKTVDYISEPSENPIEKLIIISGSQGSSPRCTKKELLFLGAQNSMRIKYRLKLHPFLTLDPLHIKSLPLGGMFAYIVPPSI